MFFCLRGHEKQINVPPFIESFAPALAEKHSGFRLLSDGTYNSEKSFTLFNEPLFTVACPCFCWRGLRHVGAG